MASEHIAVVTGDDVWSLLGGCPRSWREAADLYRRLGVRSLREAVTKVMGPEVAPAFAMRGDLVLASRSSGHLWALGICRGDLAEFMDRMLPMSQVECAWRIISAPID